VVRLICDGLAAVVSCSCSRVKSRLDIVAAVPLTNAPVVVLSGYADIHPPIFKREWRTYTCGVTAVCQYSSSRGYASNRMPLHLY
jgi:hypothetical protein